MNKPFKRHENLNVLLSFNSGHTKELCCTIIDDYYDEKRGWVVMLLYIVDGEKKYAQRKYDKLRIV